MTDIPIWQQQRAALQAEAQAVAPSPEEEITDRIRVQISDSRGTVSFPVGGTIIYTTTTEIDGPPPLTRAQIAQDLARYGHDPSVLLREWDTYTQRVGYRAAQDRLQLGAAIYRPARPDEPPDLWVSDAREGGDCQGYVRR